MIHKEIGKMFYFSIMKDIITFTLYALFDSQNDGMSFVDKQLLNV